VADGPLGPRARGKAVVTIGGFSGGDNAPTLAQLKAMIAAGELEYVLVSGGGGPGRGSSEIAAWVASHGTEVSGQSGLHTRRSWTIG
jgi:hypothetical protein